MADIHVSRDYRGEATLVVIDLSVEDITKLLEQGEFGATLTAPPSPPSGRVLRILFREKR